VHCGIELRSRSIRKYNKAPTVQMEVEYGGARARAQGTSAMTEENL